MTRKIKIIYLGLIIFGGVFIFSVSTLAHSGGTDSYGCHTCYTNCSSWGLSYGEYHCHQSKGLLQPEDPITCSFGTGCDYAPEYEYPSYNYPSYSYPSIPDCPSMSSYDSLSGSCKCYSGYVASGSKCISADQYCRDMLGWNAQYDILTDGCECSYGYIISGGRCVDGDTICHNKYGYNSSYDSLSKSCECDYGYVFGANDQCVSRDNNCQDLYGYNAEYNILKNTCACKSGYVFDSSGNNCIDGNSYCYNNYGYHSGYNSLSKTCECDAGYVLKNNECVTPEISRIYPLEAEIGGEVTIQGENFGDSEYGDLKLYIGSIKVNSLNISIWQDSKIIFEITDDLESGYVTLKDGTINVRGSYLEISEPKKVQIPVSLFKSSQKPQPKQESVSPDKAEPKIEPRREPQLSKEVQLAPQSSTKELQPSEFQKPKEEEQNGRGNVVINNQQGQEQEQKKSLSFFLASVFGALESFFLKLFR